MAKKKQPDENLRPAAALPESERRDKAALASVIDAIAEIVHQGFGRLLDPGEMMDTLDGWQPHCSMNYEYVFAWKPSLSDRERCGQTAEDCLELGTDCKWADLSLVTDSQGRDVFVLEIGDAAAGEDEDIDSIIERHQEIWQWKSGPLLIAGPFASADEAEAWMAKNGAFREVD